MSKLMKAAIAYKFGEPLQIENTPIPEIQSNQILVQIKSSGVCHTDLKEQVLLLLQAMQSRIFRKVIVSVFHGYIPRVDIVNFV
jgi:threonine dehydrogenase-like Zn-dependent dehydrogenase